MKAWLMVHYAGRGYIVTLRTMGGTLAISNWQGARGYRFYNGWGRQCC